jgi:hypothetical protein
LCLLVEVEYDEACLLLLLLLLLPLLPRPWVLVLAMVPDEQLLHRHGADEDDAGGALRTRQRTPSSRVELCQQGGRPLSRRRKRRKRRRQRRQGTREGMEEALALLRVLRVDCPWFLLCVCV